MPGLLERLAAQVGGGDAGAALSDCLGIDRDAASKALAGALLDRDGDGQVADDVAQLGSSLLGGLLKKPR